MTRMNCVYPGQIEAQIGIISIDLPLVKTILSIVITWMIEKN